MGFSGILLQPKIAHPTTKSQAIAASGRHTTWLANGLGVTPVKAIDAMFGQGVEGCRMAIDEVSRNRTLRAETTTDTFFIDIPAYKIIAGNLFPVRLIPNENTDFARYSTAWERKHSIVLLSTEEAAPVVNADLEVVGYVGWFSGHWIWAQKPLVAPKTPLATQSISPYLEQKIPVMISIHKTDKQRGWFQPFLGVNSYRVMTDPTGLVYASLGARSEAGLESSWVTPLDIFLIGRVFVELGAAGVSRLIASLVGRDLGEVAAGLAKDAGSEARDLVNAIRAEGRPVVVNIGGVGEEAGAINLNPNQVAPRTGIPNLIARPAEEIDQLFLPNSLDGIVSNRLPPNTLDWNKIIPGLKKVLRSGAKVVIRFQGVGGDAQIIEAQLRAQGLREIKNFLGAAIEAVL